MSQLENRRVVVAKRPTGEPQTSDFRLETVAVPELNDGQILLRTNYLSLDPYMRLRMNDEKSYTAPVPIGGVMDGEVVAEVIRSCSPRFKVGDVVSAYTGWQEFAVSDGQGVRKLNVGNLAKSVALGALGMPGLTAYTGLLLIGQPKPGETVVVAAATGPVGSAVGQIAKIKGARAVGIAGGAQKCSALIEEFGFDAAVDHRSADFAEQLKAACPQGIDVYFENVGGEVFKAVQPLLNDFARIPVCGLIAHYNATSRPEGPDMLPGLLKQVLIKRLTLRGFIVSDFSDHALDFYQAMSEWVASGRVRYREDFIDGLENAPDGLIGLLKGKNFGKVIVKVAPESAT